MVGVWGGWRPRFVVELPALRPYSLSLRACGCRGSRGRLVFRIQLSGFRSKEPKTAYTKALHLRVYTKTPYTETLDPRP